MIRILLFLFCLTPFTLLAQLTIPEHGGVWVHDEAGVLSANAKAELEYLLKAERDSTTNQIAILIIPTLADESEEDYTLKVVEKWKLGKKDRDNGVLFFIAVKDKKMRIEVGEGLEGVLTDAVSSRINRNQVAPHFRIGDYDGGVKAGVLAIFQAIRGEYVNTDPIPVAGKRRSRSPWLSLIVILVIIIASSRRRGGGGGGGGYLAAGALLGGLGRGGSYGGGGGGGDYGGGGSFGGGGSSDSW